MESQTPQFVGGSCGQYGVHTFYRGFQYSTKQGKIKELSLGEFFFVKISPLEDPCIGELQLLCATRNNEQHLSALRLYFLPEQTPEGRLSHHGQDELLVASDRVVLKLEDLVNWITDEVEWNHGIIALHTPLKTETSLPEEEKKTENGIEETKTETSDKEDASQIGPQVLVLSYQSYCRYRSVLRRIEGGDTDEWLQNSMLVALGGILPSARNTHILFCRDTFEHDELAHHELNCEYLAPAIKGKRRKRKTKNNRSTSPESHTSEECKVILTKTNQKINGKQPPINNEQEFLQKLFKFMKKRNTPIHRVPHLGFKQIDLYIFYSFAQKLGGYDKITTKKLWKHVYDELGGNPGSTSAATCTRRHYERLLLPFERFMAGIVYKPKQSGKKSQKKKAQQQEEEADEKELQTKNNEENTPEKASSDVPNAVIKTAEDAYTFTDSNHENSNSNDYQDEPVAETFSDEDSKTVWSIQKQPDGKDDVDKDDGKPIKPLIIQKGQSETFAERERKWDEIRRKNAAARKWVRQSRSSRGCKTPVPEQQSSVKSENGITDECVNAKDLSPKSSPVNIKTSTETIESLLSNQVPSDLPPPVAISPISVKTEVKVEQQSAVNNDSKQVEKFFPPQITPDAKVKSERNNIQKRRHSAGQEVKTTPEKKFSSNAKTEHKNKYATSWHGDNLKEFTPISSEYLKSHRKLQPPCKSVMRSDPIITHEYPLHTGRHSVDSVSASSLDAASVEDKSVLPQRRPSVIQHTEHAATSPSPSPSPRQNDADVFRNVSPKEVIPPAHLGNSKMNLLPGQISYSMNGKVAEWLTKGVHEVVACKTPSTVMEKNVELHDKVMMPSSCRTPGAVGAGKVPQNSVKCKQQSTSSHKSSRSKYSGGYRHRTSDVPMNGSYPTFPRNDIKNNNVHQKLPHHSSPVSYSVMSHANSAAKYHQQQTMNQKVKATDVYSNSPYFNQPKRYKSNIAPTTLPHYPISANARPSSSPFVKQPIYCTSPLNDLPKVTASTTHNDYETAVLDLSVKKKPPPQIPHSRQVVRPPSPVPEEGVCLDLSIKKKPIINTSSLPTDNGIENITPPLPLSPNPLPHHHQMMYSPSLPTLIALQDLEAARRNSYGTGVSRLPPQSVSSSMTCPPLVMPPAAMYPTSTHSKMPPGLIPYSSAKDLAKNMYIQSTNNGRHSQFPPYVIPNFFPTNWTSVVSAPVVKQQASNSHHQTSPIASYTKSMVNHSVFPKDYLYNVKSQYHPVHCKDNGHYPSNENK